MRTKLDAPYMSYRVFYETMPDHGLPDPGKKQTSLQNGRKNQQSLKALDVKTLSAKQSASDTIVDRGNDIKNKEGAATQGRAERAQALQTSRFAALHSDRESRDATDRTSKFRKILSNSSRRLAHKVPLIRFYPVDTPDSLSQQKNQTLPVKAAKDSKGHQVSERPTIRRYLTNPTTDAQ